MAKPSVSNIAASVSEHKAFAQPAQQKPASVAVPPTPSNTPALDARRALLVERKRSYGRSHKSRFDRRDYARIRDTLYGKRRARSIDPRVNDQARVVRTYRTSQVELNNTQGVDNTSLAWSLRLNNADGFAIKAGGPYSGTIISSTIIDDSLGYDIINLGNTFRYMKLTKISMHVEKLPLWTTMPTQVVFNSEANVANTTQLGNPGNIFSAGRYLMRPWAGEPGVCNYSNGALVGDPWQDNIKSKKAVTSPVNSGTCGTFAQTYAPYSQFLTVDVEGQNAMGNADYQVRYQKTPAVDINMYASNNQGFYAFGGVFVWYFPSSAGANDGQLATHCWWEFEMEYYGLRIAVSPALALADKTQAGRAGQLAELGVGDIKKLPEPPEKKKPSTEVVWAPPKELGDSPDYDMPDIKKMSVSR